MIVGLFFFKQKTAYEMRISDWSSDVCSSDLAFMHGPQGAIELFHGYTYSGHPLACAAALAALDVYAEENLFDKAISLGEYWENALHSLKGLPNVIDIRNFGLIGALEQIGKASCGERVCQAV